MESKTNLLLYLHEKDGYFRTRLLKAGFSENDFEATFGSNDDICEFEYFIFRTGDEVYESSHAENPYASFAVYIGEDESVIKKIIEKNDKPLDVFKDETAFFDFLYCLVVGYKFVMAGPIEFNYDINDAFKSDADDIKIIGSADLFEPVDVSEDTEPIIFVTGREDEVFSDTDAKIREFYDSMCSSVYTAFVFPQNEISVRKVFYVKKS